MNKYGRKTGDWIGVSRFYNNINRMLREAWSVCGKRIGLKGEQIIKDHMVKQDLQWDKLNPRYRAYKIRKGYSEKILIKTRSYFQSITSFSRDKKVYIGVPTGSTNSVGKRIGAYAKAHEYGQGVKKRPLFKPSKDELMDEIRNNPKYQVDSIFIDRYRKYIISRKTH